jgi:hypothetical protein
MNVKRKVQLGATAIISMGAVALGMLSPAALATTCNLRHFCPPTYGDCELFTHMERLQTCQGGAPPGCTAYAAVCDQSLPGCPNGGLACFYH